MRIVLRRAARAVNLLSDARPRTHATFRFAVDKFGVEKFDERLIAVDEFHHVSANPDNKLGLHLGQFIARDRVHILAMTGSYFRGDAEAVIAPQDEVKFDTVTYTYYEQLNGYEYLKQLDIGYFFYAGSYADDILKVLEVAATYELYNINRTKLENLIHRIFDPARLDIEIKDRFGEPVTAREWFIVPLFVVDEAVERIKDGTITGYVYDPKAAALVHTDKA